MFNSKKDLFLCIVYISPRNSNLLIPYDEDTFEIIENSIEKYSNDGIVMVTGDLNSRTATETDYIIFDRFLDNQILFPSPCDIDRAYNDVVLDANGKRILQLCKTTNLLIGNGRMSCDHITGDSTFYNNNGTSVDYFLLKYEDFKLVKHFQIMSPNEFSDQSLWFKYLYTLYFPIFRYS